MSKRNIKTVVLDGSELCVSGLGGQNTALQNLGSSTVYVSADPGIEAGGDGVMTIPSGAIATYPGTNGTIYLRGSGKVQLCGTDYGYAPFSAPTGSGSGTGGGSSDDNRNVASDEEVNNMLDGIFG